MRWAGQGGHAGALRAAAAGSLADWAAADRLGPPVSPVPRWRRVVPDSGEGVSAVAVISLQRFDHELRGRLEKLTPEEIRAAVLRHGAALPGPDRLSWRSSPPCRTRKAHRAHASGVLAAVGEVLEGRRMQ